MTAATTHRTHIVPVPGGLHQAKCDCGWRSRRTLSFSWALEDGETHEKAEQLRAEGKL